MKSPRDLAGRARDLGSLSKLKNDEFLGETFTLPVQVARLKARQILDAYPRGLLSWGHPAKPDASGGSASMG